MGAVMLRSFWMFFAPGCSERGDVAKYLARHGVKAENMKIYLGPDGLWRGSGLREI